MSARFLQLEFYNHPAAPFHVYHSSTKSNHPVSLDPRCDPTSKQFDPSFALQHQWMKFPCKKCPIYDNVAQFTSLIWKDSGLNLSGLCQSQVTFSTWLERCVQLHQTTLHEKLLKLEHQRWVTERKQLTYQRERKKITILKFRELILQLKKLIPLSSSSALLLSSHEAI
ncbi:hypothetical protein HMI54_006556 [Coelomomyces lativittatus]|nr:hypothetical protein HMI54_006556 [Coelomomyces lativittatus]KAJ1504886.1 hypothetical protein HMI55_001828 [Coelomomyces lativittatus]KAJ1506987.1 hypothetical protein HMI56_000346 [Coelomomyces lativittatus]